MDMRQFLVTFFEESFEGLERMEEGLLGLNIGAADPETINSIFRAAHSIKGGSATFGLTHIAQFTHTVETLLDGMRSGKRAVTTVNVDGLLKSVDVMKDMLTCARDGGSPDEARVTEMSAVIKGLLDEGVSGGTASVAATPAASPAASVPMQHPAVAGFMIQFIPSPGMLATGNDPARILAELSGLGELDADADISALPSLDEMDPEQSYLAWSITLTGACTEVAIRECFSWVDGECELKILAIGGAKPSPATAPAAVAPATPAAPAASVAPAVAPASAPPTPPPVAPSTTAPAATPPAATPPAATAAPARAAPAPEASIRVGIEKVDALVNLVGELVITQSMVGSLSSRESQSEAMTLALSQLERHTRDLQEAVMRIRMLPISSAFQRFPRMVRDLTAKMGKKIELRMHGGDTEVDKTVLEKIGDPLNHLVRNSIDHGIEMPDLRRERGKPETGIVEMDAYHQGGAIVIEVRDDGGGLPRDKLLKKATERGLIPPGTRLTDDEILNLIFLPGFSTAEQVSDVSGRGVGMDVVRRNIQELGGNVEIRSVEGRGSTFLIRLPLTLAIMDGQLVRVDGETYIVPVASIVESLSLKPGDVHTVTGEPTVYRLRSEYIPVFPLKDIFGGQPAAAPPLLVVVQSHGERAGLLVDDLLGQQQVVIKSLEANFQKVSGLSGATILGDGSVALILDIADLLKLARRRAVIRQAA